MATIATIGLKIAVYTDDVVRGVDRAVMKLNSLTAASGTVGLAAVRSFYAIREIGYATRILGSQLASLFPAAAPLLDALTSSLMTLSLFVSGFGKLQANILAASSAMFSFNARIFGSGVSLFLRSVRQMGVLAAASKDDIKNLAAGVRDAAVAFYHLSYAVTTVLGGLAGIVNNAGHITIRVKSAGLSLLAFLTALPLLRSMTGWTLNLRSAWDKVKSAIAGVKFPSFARTPKPVRVPLRVVPAPGSQRIALPLVKPPEPVKVELPAVTVEGASAAIAEAAKAADATEDLVERFAKLAETAEAARAKAAAKVKYPFAAKVIAPGSQEYYDAVLANAAARGQKKQLKLPDLELIQTAKIAKPPKIIEVTTDARDAAERALFAYQRLASQPFTVKATEPLSNAAHVAEKLKAALFLLSQEPPGFATFGASLTASLERQLTQMPQVAAKVQKILTDLQFTTPDVILPEDTRLNHLKPDIDLATFISRIEAAAAKAVHEAKIPILKIPMRPAGLEIVGPLKPDRRIPLPMVSAPMTLPSLKPIPGQWAEAVKPAANRMAAKIKDALAFAGFAGVALIGSALDKLQPRLNSATQRTAAFVARTKSAGSSIGSAIGGSASRVFNGVRAGFNAIRGVAGVALGFVTSILTGLGLVFAVTGTAAAAFAAIVGTVGVALTRMAMSAVESVHRVNAMARELGVSFNSMQSLLSAGLRSGVDTSAMERGLGHLQNLLGELTLGSYDARRTFRLLGLEASQFRGAGTDEAFFRIIQHLRALPSDAARSAQAMQLFGRESFRSIMRIVNNPAIQSLEQIQNQLRGQGQLLDPAQVALAERAHDAFQQIQSAAAGVVQQIGVGLSPLIISIIDNIRSAISSTGDWGDMFTTISDAALSVGRVLAMGLGVGLETMAQLASWALTFGRYGVQSIRAILRGMQSILEAASNLPEWLGGGAANDAAAGIGSALGALDAAATGMQNAAETLGNSNPGEAIVEAWGNIENGAQQIAQQTRDAIRNAHREGGGFAGGLIRAGMQQGTTGATGMMQRLMDRASQLRDRPVSEKFLEDLREVEQLTRGVNGANPMLTGDEGARATLGLMEGLERDLGATETKSPQALEQGSTEAGSAIAKIFNNRNRLSAQERMRQLMEEARNRDTIRNEYARQTRDAIRNMRLVNL